MRRFLSITAVTLTFALVCCTAQAKKPDNPGGGGGGKDTPPEYTLVDLLGFANDWGYQSRARFVLNRNSDGETQVYGESYTVIPGQPAMLTPAIWHIDADGNFPPSDPVDQGLPSFSREVEPMGFNDAGVGVGWNRWANQMDDQGNWVFPGYADVPGIGYLELPGTVNRNTSPNAINNAGIIVGTYAEIDDDPNSPDGLRGAGGMWQLLPDGTITGPVELVEFYPDDINSFGVMAGRSLGYVSLAWFDEEGLLQVLRLDTSLRFFGPFVEALNAFPIGDPRLTVVGASWLNEAGEYNEDDSIRAFAWRPFDAADPTTVMGTLGGTQSRASDVNDHGQIVGWSETRRDGPRAFIYENGEMRNLNELCEAGKARLQRANAISNDGDIVGFMQIPRPISEQRGFLLRPIE